MTPAALSTYRDLRSLGVPGAVLRKITIATDGKPVSRLNDVEFDDLAREVRRKYPTLADPAQGGWGSARPG